MKTLKQIYKDIDLYGVPVFVQQLKKDFTFCSYCAVSIPGKRSPVYKTSQLKGSFDILRATFHKNSTVTLKTNAGYLHFF